MGNEVTILNCGQLKKSQIVRKNLANFEIMEWEQSFMMPTSAPIICRFVEQGFVDFMLTRMLPCRIEKLYNSFATRQAWNFNKPMYLLYYTKSLEFNYGTCENMKYCK